MRMCIVGVRGFLAREYVSAHVRVGWTGARFCRRVLLLSFFFFFSPRGFLRKLRFAEVKLQFGPRKGGARGAPPGSPRVRGLTEGRPRGGGPLGAGRRQEQDGGSGKEKQVEESLNLGSIWGKFGVNLKSIWGQFGANLGPTGGNLGPIWGEFGIKFSLPPPPPPHSYPQLRGVMYINPKRPTFSTRP